MLKRWFLRLGSLEISEKMLMLRKTLYKTLLRWHFFLWEEIGATAMYGSRTVPWDIESPFDQFRDGLQIKRAKNITLHDHLAWKSFSARYWSQLHKIAWAFQFHEPKKKINCSTKLLYAWQIQNKLCSTKAKKQRGATGSLTDPNAVTISK